jgi:hypothetical protein
MILTVWIYILYISVRCSNPKSVAHLKEINGMLQPYITSIEQCAHLRPPEESLDFAAVLLGFNKGMYLVESSR